MIFIWSWEIQTYGLTLNMQVVYRKKHCCLNLITTTKYIDQCEVSKHVIAIHTFLQHKQKTLTNTHITAAAS